MLTTSPEVLDPGGDEIMGGSLDSGGDEIMGGSLDSGLIEVCRVPPRLLLEICEIPS
jgi:hypothetical protein